VPCMTSVGALTSPSRSLQRSPESMPAWLVMLEAKLGRLPQERTALFASLIFAYGLASSKRCPRPHRTPHGRARAVRLSGSAAPKEESGRPLVVAS
jgi:hypothetical protein